MSQFFPLGGQSIGVSKSASFFPMNIQKFFFYIYIKKTFLILIAKLFKAGIKKESIQYTFYIK